MKEYFKLQYLMTNRKITDFGLHPVIGYLLLLFVFIPLSLYLFYKTPYAACIYCLIPLFFVIKLSEIKRNDFLKTCFSNRNYWTIRIAENLLAGLPFLIFLVFKQEFYPTIILVALSVLLAGANFKASYNLTLPTPFYKKPFEFTVGFRNTFYLFIIAYCLTAIGILVNNFNLGVFALLLSFLSILSYYLKPENEYFVWSYSLTPAQFLKEKIKTALLFSSLLILPIVITLGIFYANYAGITLIFTLLGYLYLTTLILAKYSVYPEEINLPQTIILVISMVFPVILIAVIPYFTNQSVKRLEEILT